MISVVVVVVVVVVAQNVFFFFLFLVLVSPLYSKICMFERFLFKVVFT